MEQAADVVERALAGDSAAFADIYDSYATPIYDFCRSILRNEADAADAAQDTFLAAHQKLADLNDPAKLRPWLYSIARRQSLRRVDDRRRHVDDQDFDLMSAGGDDLDRELDAEEAAALVWDSAVGLAPKDRLVLDLHLRHGLAGQELAEALDVNRQHAYVLIDKMKNALSRSAGSLLVARYKRRDCEELDALLAGWDGMYDPLIRKRVARHVDRCDTCERHRAALIAPDRLFSIVPLAMAPVALRGRVLEAINALPTTEPGATPRRPWPTSGLRLALMVLLLAAIAGVIAASAFGGGDSETPNTVNSIPETRSTVPAVATTAEPLTTTDSTAPTSTPPQTTAAAPSTGVTSTSEAAGAVSTGPQVTVTVAASTTAPVLTAIAPTTAATTTTSTTTTPTTTTPTTTTTVPPTSVVAGPIGGG